MDKISVTRQSENETLLTEYTSILLKNIEEGVATLKEEEGGKEWLQLNQVQQDLKKLQWTMRTRFFHGEYSEPNGYPDSSALKRKRADDSSICIPADIKNDLRLIRRDLGFHEKKEVLELTLPKEDKYALLPEPYCVLIGKTNSSFLDALIQETSRHCDKRGQEITNSDEPVSKCSRKMLDSKRNSLHLIVDSFGSVTQKLLSALVQDKPLSSDRTPTVTKPSENGTRTTKLKNRNSLDRRLLKELMEQGILTPEDINKRQDAGDDETSAETKKGHS